MARFGSITVKGGGTLLEWWQSLFSGRRKDFCLRASPQTAQQEWWHGYGTVKPKYCDVPGAAHAVPLLSHRCDDGSQFGRLVSQDFRLPGMSRPEWMIYKCWSWGKSWQTQFWRWKRWLGWKAFRSELRVHRSTHQLSEQDTVPTMAIFGSHSPISGENVSLCRSEEKRHQSKKGACLLEGWRVLSNSVDGLTVRALVVPVAHEHIHSEFLRHLNPLFRDPRS